MEEFEGRRRRGMLTTKGMVHHSLQLVEPCLIGDEWGLGTRGLGIEVFTFVLIIFIILYL